MLRLIRHDATGPIEIPPQEKSVWVRACGLSQNMPLCDGSHKVCLKGEEDGRLHVYDKDRRRVVEIRKDDV